MDILAVSVFLRYLELCGEECEFPDNAYQGDYVFDIAASLHRDLGEELRQPLDGITGSLPADGDQLLDTLILRAKTLLGKEAFTQIHDLARDTLVIDIRKDLSQFRVTFDHWFSENTLVTGNAVARAVEKLTENGLMYELSLIHI